MIYLYEQYGFLKEDRCLPTLDDNSRNKLCKDKEYKLTFERNNENQLCCNIYFDEKKKNFHFQTSYFVGIDWIDENSRLSVYVQPKLNKEEVEINYLKILLDSLQEPENFKYLTDLVHIDFRKPYIPITQKQDLLSPFLIAQFLQMVKRIVQKGLKKSYYTVTANLNARIRGKIIIDKNIKQNTARGKLTNTTCQYQEFGVNCDDNKILKKAIRFSYKVIQQYGSVNAININELLCIFNYISPPFESISDDLDNKYTKLFKTNPLFKEYDQAIKLAQLILKRYSYNIAQTEQEQVMTPPFWIDMSKLFELYVFKQLKAIFSNGVKYHFKAKRQELDFVLKSEDQNFLFVIDTKYKPKYEDHSISIEDIRQISGYARLEKVYEELNITDLNQNIKCLIIYSHQDCDEILRLEHFELNEKKGIKNMKEQSGYVNLYKLGIKLPEVL